MKPLTQKQQAILTYIEQFVEERHYPPTYEEIRAGVGLSTKSLVDYHLNALEAAGYIQRDRLTPRGLRLRADNGTFSVPLYGSIGASLPATFYTDAAAEALFLTRDIVPDQADLFALKVRGTSMIDAMVNDGDIVVMKKQSVAKDGDMVAVRLIDRDETTLKHFYREPGRVRLQPANPTMTPIFVNPANVEIQGRVVAVIRQVH
ncbi:MAG: transcriptional repressor LexA [Anaerolineae bacterium]